MESKKAVLIIGAGDATGSAIARRFAREGYVACVTRRSEDKLAPLLEQIRSEGGEAYGFGSDARKEEEMVALVQKIMAKRFAEQPLADLPDGLHAGICGSGSPFPDARRGSPCTLVIAGQRLFVFDTGSSASTNITRMGFDLGSIEAVFLTHFHSDHIGGLGDVMLNRWVAGANTTPVPVHGPIGVKAVVDGFMQSYYQDHLYRIAHHGEHIIPPGGFGGIPTIDRGHRQKRMKIHIH